MITAQKFDSVSKIGTLESVGYRLGSHSQMLPEPSLASNAQVSDAPLKGVIGAETQFSIPMWPLFGLSSESLVSPDVARSAGHGLITCVSLQIVSAWGAFVARFFWKSNLTLPNSALYLTAQAFAFALSRLNPDTLTKSLTSRDNIIYDLEQVYPFWRGSISLLGETLDRF